MLIHAQHSFSNGEISKRFWGRTDTSLYRQGVANATNVMLTEAGSLRKRPGFETLIQGGGTTQFIPFIVGSNAGDLDFTEDIFLELTENRLRVIRGNADGLTVLATFTTTYDERQLFRIKHAQQGNDVFLAHRGDPLMKLTRSANGTSWTFTEVSIDGWNTEFNYPGSVSFYKQRMILASSQTNLRRIAMSAVGDFTDFTVGTDADSALQFELASDVNEVIVTILPYETFIIFTTAGIWVSDNEGAITPTNVSFSKRSNIGIHPRTNPLIMKGDIFYVTPTQSDVVLFEYEEQRQKYNSKSITKLFRHLFEGKIIVNMAGSNSQNLLLIIFDSTEDTCTGREVVCIRYERETGIQGATIWDTNGTIEDIQSNQQQTGFFSAITRGDESNIEFLDFLGTERTDPGGEYYITGIVTLPFESENVQIPDIVSVNSVFVKTDNTEDFQVKTISDGVYLSHTAPNTDPSISEVPVNSKYDRTTQLFFRTENDKDFELLSYSVDGVARRRGGR